MSIMGFPDSGIVPERKIQPQSPPAGDTELPCPFCHGSGTMKRETEADRYSEKIKPIDRSIPAGDLADIPKNRQSMGEYRSWYNMKQRCINPKSTKYADYGGRGIKVCDRWLESFENFYLDMGPRAHGLELDRVDNDGDYEPSNCRWTTRVIQNRNRRLSAHNPSGQAGVYWDIKQQKWWATVCLNDRYIKLGAYVDVRDAIKARIEGEKQYYGK